MLTDGSHVGPLEHPELCSLRSRNTSTTTSRAAPPPPERPGELPGGAGRAAGAAGVSRSPARPSPTTPTTAGRPSTRRTSRSTTTRVWRRWPSGRRARRSGPTPGWPRCSATRRASAPSWWSPTTATRPTARPRRPYNTIRVYAVPPESGSVLNDERDWLEAVIAHEYVHILHLDNIGGCPATGERLFGKNTGREPTASHPGWTDARGWRCPRGPGRQRRRPQRQRALRHVPVGLVVEPPGFPTLAMASDPYLEWPRGDVSYLLGGHFMAWNGARSGPGDARLPRRPGARPSGRRPPVGHRALVAPTCRPLRDQFAGELRAPLRGRSWPRCAGAAVTRPAPLTPAAGLHRATARLPDGSGVAYVDRGLDEWSGLRRVTKAPAPIWGGPWWSTWTGPSRCARPSQAVVAKGQSGTVPALHRPLPWPTWTAAAIAGSPTANGPPTGRSGRDGLGGLRGAGRRRRAGAAAAGARRRAGRDPARAAGVELYEPAVWPDGAADRALGASATGGVTWWAARGRPALARRHQRRRAGPVARQAGRPTALARSLLRPRRHLQPLRSLGGSHRPAIRQVDQLESGRARPGGLAGRGDAGLRHLLAARLRPGHHPLPSDRLARPRPGGAGPWRPASPRRARTRR